MDEPLLEPNRKWYQNTLQSLKDYWPWGIAGQYAKKITGATTSGYFNEPEIGIQNLSNFKRDKSRKDFIEGTSGDEICIDIVDSSGESADDEEVICDYDAMYDTGHNQNDNIRLLISRKKKEYKIIHKSYTSNIERSWYYQKSKNYKLIQSPREFKSTDQQSKKYQLKYLKKDIAAIEDLKKSEKHEEIEHTKKCKKYNVEVDGIAFEYDGHEFAVVVHDLVDSETFVDRVNRNDLRGAIKLSCLCHPNESDNDEALTIDLQVATLKGHLKIDSDFSELFGSESDKFYLYIGFFTFKFNNFIITISKDGRRFINRNTMKMTRGFDEDRKGVIIYKVDLDRFEKYGYEEILGKIKNCREANSSIRNRSTSRAKNTDQNITKLFHPTFTTDQIIINLNNHSFHVGWPDIQQELTKGGFGTVYATKLMYCSCPNHKITQNQQFSQIVFKVIHCADKNNIGLQEITEILVMEKLRGGYDLGPYLGSFIWDDKVIIVMEYYEMSLADYGKELEKQKQTDCAPINMAMSVFISTINHLEALNKILPGFCHGDLKPDNLLIKRTGKQFLLSWWEPIVFCMIRPIWGNSRILYWSFKKIIGNVFRKSEYETYKGNIIYFAIQVLKYYILFLFLLDVIKYNIPNFHQYLP